jgi:hypothetical protein
MKFKTLVNALNKVGIPAECGLAGMPHKIDLGYGASLHLDCEPDGRLSCILARDVVGGDVMFLDATRWASCGIADWASIRYAGRRVIRGLNVADGEFWFVATVSRKHLERNGAPADVLSPVGAKVKYILSFTDAVAAVTAVPI